MGPSDNWQTIRKECERQPNKIHLMAYESSVNSSVVGQPFNITCDLLNYLGMPPNYYVNLDDIDINKDYVFVTAASSSYFSGMKSTVSSIQHFRPGHQIIVYDIGLMQEEVEEVNHSICTVPTKITPSNSLSTYRL